MIMTMSHVTVCTSVLIQACAQKSLQSMHALPALTVRTPGVDILKKYKYPCTNVSLHGQGCGQRRKNRRTLHGGLEPPAVADAVAFLDAAEAAPAVEQAEAAPAAGAGFGEAGKGAVAISGPDGPMWAAGTPLDGVVASAG